MRRLAAVLASLLFAATLSAQTVTPVIDSISPTSIPVNTPEQFIDIYGANFYGGTQTFVTYSGPEGVFTLMASAGSGDHIQAYVPDAILLSQGTYSVVVTNDDGVNPPASSNAATLTITGGPGPNIFVPESVTAEATGPGGAVVTYEVVATSTSDPDPDVTCTQASGTLFPVGETVVTCTATDDQGQTASDDFVVAVVDTTPPALDLPDDITTPATSSSGAVVTFTATANDLVDGNVAVTCQPPSGSTFPIGTTTVNCSATDAHGNSAQGSFDVTVTEPPNQPPVLQLPGTITREATSSAGAVVTYTATASDPEDGALTAVCTPASGSTFHLGTTTVNCSATDSDGATTSGSFNVVVVDTTAPVITSVTASPNVLAPANNKMRAVTISVAATDAVDGSLTAQITGVTANEAIDGTDYTITGPLTLDLRAERNGSVDRVYTVTVAVSDDAGNTSTRTVAVTVKKK